MTNKQVTLDTPPLVHGSRRGQPGRPRTGDHGIFGKPDHGHNLGTVMMKPRTQSGNGDGAQVRIAVVPVSPRLLDLHTAAAYMGVSEWTIRELEASGTIPRIRIPLANAGELRKLLFDRADLDRLIEQWKDAAKC